ncbi:hypothetical protein DDB_G0292526 [Dictyostelium discoideum AX4]|uniref:Uncharacterized protein DDB_G0292526 n=1 Tax=Dictyostelium discoideum TaxID=44689 RepID=Y4105_DICDI|nr:hypothetical protein DDB_G0292526 [Dictyostelium discoideum AX4]B0G195.1 RecName: Full=Uncharacterized protein DDB_G0292526 [Dictyostelium discoideum]EDR41014.1 hypothetical protein DDB_G0292526 [Dictyostelium discoideum AX4]|eukprot:XP_001733060.1 hypothetical protein DDB_G0292526 [Dictyostelium discoideum AX4]
MLFENLNNFSLKNNKNINQNIKMSCIKNEKYNDLRICMMVHPVAPVKTQRFVRVEYYP